MAFLAVGVRVAVARHSGAYMHRFAWTHIVRHMVVKSGASPDDRALADYWACRRRKPILPINNTTLRLLKAQGGRCPICKTRLFADDQQPQTPSGWEQCLTSTRTTITIVKPVTPDTADHRVARLRVRPAAAAKRRGTAP